MTWVVGNKPIAAESARRSQLTTCTESDAIAFVQKKKRFDILKPFRVSSRLLRESWISKMYSLFCRSECLVAASETTAMVVDKSVSRDLKLKHSTDQAVLTLFENFCFQASTSLWVASTSFAASCPSSETQPWRFSASKTTELQTSIFAPILSLRPSTISNRLFPTSTCVSPLHFSLVFCFA